MRESDIVRVVTIRHKSEGADQAKADLRGIAAAQNELAQSSTNLGKATETSASKQASVTTQFERLVKSLDPAARAMAELTKNSKILGTGLAQDASRVDQYVASMEALIEKTNKALGAGERLATLRMRINEISGPGRLTGKSAADSAEAFMAPFGGLEGIARAKAEQVGKAFTAELDRSLVSGTGKAARDSGAVFAAELDRLDQIATAKATQIGNNFQRSLNEHMRIEGRSIGSDGFFAPSRSARDSANVFQFGDDKTQTRAKFDPVFAAGQQYKRTLLEITEAVKNLELSETQAAAARNIAKTTVQNQVHALREGAAAGRLMSGEMANLSFQLNDVVTGLALGQSPFMIIAQQGGQVYQILANSKASVKDFMGEIVSGAARAFTPLRMLVGGVAAVGAAALVIGNNWAEAGHEIDRALTGIGRRSGETRSSIAKFANDNSSLTGLSVAEARNVGIEFAKTGNLTASALKGVGDAVKGYSILTGKDATEATKDLASALSGNLVEAALKVDSVYGVMNAATLESVRSLEAQGKRAEAVQLILDRMADTNKKASESVGFWSRLGTGIANFASNVFNGIPSSGDDDIQAQIDAVQKQRERAMSGRSRLTSRTFLNGVDGGEISALGRLLEQLQAKMDSLNANKAATELGKISVSAFQIGQAILPQIDAIAKLDAELVKLEKLKPFALKPDEIGPSPAPSNLDAIIDATRRLRDLQQESLAAVQRQGQYVDELRAKYGGVSAQTAVALQSLQDQANVARQITGAKQIEAQQQATINSLRAEGKSQEEATAIAVAQANVARASATANVERQTRAVRDQTRMIEAQGTGMEAVTAAGIAYRNAIESGASHTAAAALRAATLRQHMEQAAAAARQMAQAEIDAADAADYGRYVSASGDPNMIAGGDTGGYARSPESRMGAGGSNRSEFEISGDPFISSSGSWTSPELLDPQLIINAVTARSNRFTEGVEAVTLGAARALREAMEDQTRATEANTAAITVALNPLYTQGRGSAIEFGYMHAAKGLDMMVQGGIPGVDSVPINIMAQQGERVQVTPAGQVSNDNSNTSNVTVNQYFGGGLSNRSRRNARQSTQKYAQMLAAVS